MEKITTEDLRQMMLLSYDRVEAEKEKINNINVFPVPDQDTGGNLAKTLLGVKCAIKDKRFKNLESFSEAALYGAFEAAQGNAGVIYTGFLSGFLPGLHSKNPISSDRLAFAMNEGAISARKSIQNPQEGTILDVIDASAKTIRNESQVDKDIISLFKKIIQNANKALLATRDKMEVLRKANVVDAGGLGYLIILESYLDALEGNNGISITQTEASEKNKGFTRAIYYRYEVVFLIRNLKTTRAILAEKLSKLGDSIEVLKIQNRIKVHIHTDQPSKIKKIAAESGDVENIKIEDMAMNTSKRKGMKKNNIGIMVDEAADLPKKIIDKYQLNCVQYTIDWPEGKNLSGDNIYQKMREADKKGIKKLPKTSQPSPKKFLDAYQKTLKKSSKKAKVISIVLSSKLSGAYNSANQASEIIKGPSNLIIFDSLHASAGQALIVLRAIELREEQKNFDEIIEGLNRLIPKVQLFGVLEDPKWIEFGGRMSHSQAAWVRRMGKLGIRPLLKLKDGKIEKGGVVFGARNLSTALFKKIKKNSEKYRKENKKIRAVINHCDNKSEAEKLRKKLKEIGIETSYINLVSPLIGVHVGPGSLIAAYMPLG